jgi:hypothetical protein
MDRTVVGGQKNIGFFSFFESTAEAVTLLHDVPESFF